MPRMLSISQTKSGASASLSAAADDLIAPPPTSSLLPAKNEERVLFWGYNNERGSGSGAFFSSKLKN